MKPIRSRAAAFVLMATALGGCHTSLVPTPNLYRAGYGGAGYPVESVAADRRDATTEVIYATDRARVDPDDASAGYSHLRSSGLAFGVVDVEFGTPDAADRWARLAEDSGRQQRRDSWPVKLGSIEELGRLRDTPSDPMFDGQWGPGPGDMPVPDESLRAFSDLVRASMRESDDGLVQLFVHGVAQDFPDAPRILAQLWHFSGRHGVPVTFTWPSSRPSGFDVVGSYSRDRESAQFSVSHLKQLLRAMAATEGVRAINVIAHSHGTVVATSAIRELVIADRAAGLDPRATLRINNLVLAAPDMDASVLLERVIAEGVHVAARRTTIYTSEDDVLLGAAAFAFGSVRRIGDAILGEVPVESFERGRAIAGVDVVDVVAPTGASTHNYFFAHAGALSDLVLILRDDRAPGAENGRPLVPVGSGVWLLESGYPGHASNG